MSEEKKTEYFAIEITNASGIDVVCFAVGKKNARNISQSLYRMRGFFAKDFEEVLVNIRDTALPVEINIDYDFSPVTAEVNTMNFHNAVEAMKLGNKVRRLSWPEEHCIWKGQGHLWVTYQNSQEPWIPNLQDFEATDWWVVV